MAAAPAVLEEALLTAPAAAGLAVPAASFNSLLPQMWKKEKLHPHLLLGGAFYCMLRLYNNTKYM